MIDDELHPGRALTEQEALAALREAGVIEAASIAALGRMWGWKRERASKALPRWERTGRIEREPGTGRKIVIRMREGAGNGNGNTGNGTGPGHKRRAGMNGNATGTGPPFTDPLLFTVPPFPTLFPFPLPLSFTHLRSGTGSPS